jgi:transcriptional regulator with XRE-family HTH domain
MSARSQALGDLLAARRAELGYTLAATTKRCEKPISTAYLQKLESGKVEQPSPFVLHELAHALQLPYVALMETAGYVWPCGHEPPRPGKLVESLLSAEDLTEDEQIALAGFFASVLKAWRENLRRGE